jgi:hypothetical protein
MARNTRWVAIVNKPKGGQKKVALTYGRPDADPEVVHRAITILHPMPELLGQTGENVKLYGPFPTTLQETEAVARAQQASSLNANVELPPDRELPGVPDLDPDAQPVEGQPTVPAPIPTTFK